MDQDIRIVIIGGGLSGLTLAYWLAREGVAATILEASSRVGGRIQTAVGAKGTPLELGATWFSDMHAGLIALLEELGLEKFPQYSRGKCFFETKSFEPPQEFFIPETEAPSYRLVGGTQTLIDVLVESILDDQIKLDTRVVAIEEVGNDLVVQTQNGEVYVADKVILCLPPQLLGSSITFRPPLPTRVATVLPSVQTWMAGSIKFVLEYLMPFWRDNGYSGMLYSHVGIVSEMYDHSNFEANRFGFTGFLHAGSVTYPEETRRRLVLEQLEKLLGRAATSPLTYMDKVWTDSFVVDGPPQVQRPHQNNGHPTLQEVYLNGKLYFSGTETSPDFSGYMEGAVRSAKSTFKKIVEIEGSS